MDKNNLNAHFQKYKFVYDRKSHVKPNAPNYLGVPYKDHYITEMWGVPMDIIAKEDIVSKNIDSLMTNLKLHPLNKFTYQFTPHGVTGFVILEESHLAIHTWPELNYLLLELVTCSKTVDYSKLDESVDKLFKPKYFESTELIY